MLARRSIDHEASAVVRRRGASLHPRAARVQFAVDHQSSAALVGGRECSIGLGGEVRQRREARVVPIGVAVGARAGYDAAALSRLAIEQQPMLLKVAGAERAAGLARIRGAPERLARSHERRAPLVGLTTQARVAVEQPQGASAIPGRVGRGDLAGEAWAARVQGAEVGFDAGGV